jgi:hypothetical protein
MAAKVLANPSPDTGSAVVLDPASGDAHLVSVDWRRPSDSHDALQREVFHFGRPGVDRSLTEQAAAIEATCTFFPGRKINRYDRYQ